MNFQEKKREREKNSHKQAHNHGDKKQAKVFEHSPSVSKNTPESRSQEKE